jgi:hypothetical protein
VIKAVLLAASSAHENRITIPLIALRAEQKPCCDVWGFDTAGRMTDQDEHLKNKSLKRNDFIPRIVNMMNAHDKHTSCFK